MKEEVHDGDDDGGGALTKARGTGRGRPSLAPTFFLFIPCSRLSTLAYMSTKSR